MKRQARRQTLLSELAAAGNVNENLGPCYRACALERGKGAGREHACTQICARARKHIKITDKQASDNADFTSF